MRLLQACLCTHNPRSAVFCRVLGAIARQTRLPADFEIVIIDNASTPPITEAECRAAVGAVPLRIVREPNLGIAAARVRCVSETNAEWVLLVDDDTELMPDYVECALRVIAENPKHGCFGGKLLLPDYIAAARWTEPLLGFLAIRDVGDVPITASTSDWGIWEPPGAGAVVRRPLLDHYRAVMQENHLARQLGRKGARSLGASEDSLLMSGAYDLGLTAAYQPSLQLIHHLDPSRLGFGYLLRFMYAHGRSRILLECLLRDAGRRPQIESGPGLLSRMRRALFRTFLRDPGLSIRYACCTTAYRAGTLTARLKAGIRTLPAGGVTTDRGAVLGDGA